LGFLLFYNTAARDKFRKILRGKSEKTQRVVCFASRY